MTALCWVIYQLKSSLSEEDIWNEANWLWWAIGIKVLKFGTGRLFWHDWFWRQLSHNDLIMHIIDPHNVAIIFDIASIYPIYTMLLYAHLIHQNKLFTVPVRYCTSHEMCRLQVFYRVVLRSPKIMVVQFTDEFIASQRSIKFNYLKCIPHNTATPDNPRDFQSQYLSCNPNITIWISVWRKIGLMAENGVFF